MQRDIAVDALTMLRGALCRHAAWSITSTRMALKGDNQAVLRFLQDAGVEQRMHVAVHSLYVAVYRRAASRIVTGPAPAKARINSHRFAVNSWNRSSGAAKLMREPCFLPRGFNYPTHN